MPLASGVVAVGRTRRLPKVAIPPPLAPPLAVAVKVIAELVRDVNEIAKGVPPVVSPLIVTVGDVDVVSHSKPVGALKMIVPAPIEPLVDSVKTGPVSEVKPAPPVSAEIEPPPVAAVTLTVAIAGLALTRKTRLNRNGTRNLGFRLSGERWRVSAVLLKRNFGSANRPTGCCFITFTNLL